MALIGAQNEPDNRRVKVILNGRAGVAGPLRYTRMNRLHKHRYNRASRTHIPRPLMVFFIVLFTLLMLFMGSSGAVYAYYQAQLPLLNGIAQHTLFQTTRIYDRNGKLLAELYDQATARGRRTYVNYQNISPLLVEATVAAEDHTFWTNSGVDYYGIARAAVSDVQSDSAIEGGSTITQQLIKNQFFMNQKRTLPTKSEEAILATGLTQQYPKWKIMEMYLNTVFYGDQNYGVEAAAEDYFGLKPHCVKQTCTNVVAHLTLAQASLLAGLPQGPSEYQPNVYKSNALQRQKVVLQEMVGLKYITQKQARQAEKETANYHFHSYLDTHTLLAPHFVNYLLDAVLFPLFGAQNLEDGGYNIYTTLDLDLEKKVEQIAYDHLYKDVVNDYIYPGVLSGYHNVHDAAVVVMNPKNGEILAMDGSADYNMNTPQIRGQDNAAIADRSPGSSFKPIVYATAFEMGWYPAMNVPDHRTYYPNGTQPYTLNNYDMSFHGDEMTIRRAIGNSYNIPAVDAIEYTGIPNVLNMAARLGLTNTAALDANKIGAATAIGANGESLLNMTGAYATFANQGVRNPVVSILRITNNEGKMIYQFDENQPKGVRVLRADVAYLMTNVLSDKSARYQEFSPGNPLEMDRPAAAKTGTTDGFTDNWTMGYTPYLTVGVWAGNSDNSMMNNVIGITGAAPIWHDVMEYASQRYQFPPSNFARPSDVHEGVVSALTGLAASPGEPVTPPDVFIDGTMPTITGSWYYYVPPVINPYYPPVAPVQTPSQPIYPRQPGATATNSRQGVPGQSQNQGQQQVPANQGQNARP